MYVRTYVVGHAQECHVECHYIHAPYPTSALHTCGHESRAVAACMGGAP